MADPKIFISQESREYFGNDVVSFVEQNAKLQPYALNIVTDADTRGPGPGVPVDLDKWKDRDTRQRQQFADAGQSDIREAVLGRIYNGEKEHAEAGAYRQSGVPAPAEPPPKSFVIPISTIDDPKELFAEMAGAPEKDVQNVPGTTKDWRAWSLMHESSHNRHDHYAGNTRDVGAERQADQDANEMYAQAHKQGIVSDPKIPEAVESARAMRYMRTQQSDADSARRYALAGVDSVDTSSGDAILRQAYDVEKAKTAVLAKIGDSAVSEDDRLKAQIRATGTNVADLPPTLAKYIQDGSANDPKASIPDEVKTSLQGMTIDPAVQAQIDKDANYAVERMASAAGEDMANKDPALLYSTARSLSEQGAFKDNPVQQQFIDSFQRGAETYAPGFYKVPAADAAPALKSEASQPEAVAEGVAPADADASMRMVSAAEAQALLGRPTALSASSVEQEQQAPPPAATPAPVRPVEFGAG